MEIGDLLSRAYSFQLPRKILFGVGTAERVGSEARTIGGKEVLLVTDQNLVRMDIPRRVEELLVKEGFDVNVFSDVEAEPRIEMAEEVAQAARTKRYHMIVGVGGGSVLDMAKVASIAATNLRPMRHYVGVDLVQKAGLPKVLVPTTAGTGSEVTNTAVVSFTEDEIKTAIVTPYMIADVAIVDPSLTYTMPPRVTASTGLDALSHALEAILSVNANLITDSLALESARLICKRLPLAYRRGDSESRYWMSLGALMAGMALGNAGVCLGHALAYTFAVAYRVPHGISCGLVLPYIFRYNASAISWKLPRVSEAMGIDAKTIEASELTSSISESIFRLMGEIEAPARLRDVGIPEEAIAKMADRLFSIRRLIQRNPKPVTKEDALKLIGDMW